MGRLRRFFAALADGIVVLAVNDPWVQLLNPDDSDEAERDTALFYLGMLPYW